MNIIPECEIEETAIGKNCITHDVIFGSLISTCPYKRIAALEEVGNRLFNVLSQQQYQEIPAVGWPNIAPVANELKSLIDSE